MPTDQEPVPCLSLDAPRCDCLELSLRATLANTNDAIFQRWADEDGGIVFCRAATKSHSDSGDAHDPVAPHTEAHVTINVRALPS